MELAKARKIRQHGPRERSRGKDVRVPAAGSAPSSSSASSSTEQAPSLTDRATRAFSPRPGGGHADQRGQTEGKGAKSPRVGSAYAPPGRGEKVRAPRPVREGADKSDKPTRTCVACREESGRGELLRLVESPDGRIALDARSRIGGRGAWVHPTRACIEMAAKRHAAERSLKVSVRDVDAAGLIEGAATAYRRRIDSLITAAWRARGLEIGVAASVDALETRRVPLVLVATDAGSERKAVEGDGAERARAVRVFGTKEELGRLFRRSEVAMIAVTEPGIAAELESTIDRLAGLED